MLALVLAAALAAPQEPLRVAVFADEAEESIDKGFLRGVRRAADAANKDGVNGSKVEVRVVPVPAAPTAVLAAVDALKADGAVAVIAPQAAWIADAVRRASVGKLACSSFVIPPTDALALVDRVLHKNFCMDRVGFVHDKTKESVEFGKWLARGGLTAPTELAWEIDVAAAPKAVQKQFEKERPQVLLVDADPPAVAKFVKESLGADRIPIVLMPRAWDASLLTMERRWFVVQGPSMASSTTSTAVRTDYERDHGVPGFGVAEGYEAMLGIVEAARAAKANDPASIATGLPKLVLSEVRGRTVFDLAIGAFVPGAALWIAQGGALVPYVPGIVAARAVGTSAGTDTKPERPPQKQIGEPFGTWRTRQFAPEDGAQTVLLDWATDGGFASSEEDLKQLGLSTGGADPLVDHLVREEILARILAIASTKFGRKEDGSGVVGKSLKIVFVKYLAVKDREKKRLRLWPAYVGGDHPEAGGEAFGTYCRVYSTFIRRTIFQSHALAPAVSTSDLEFLDGTYAFSADYAKDKRSELIRALVNGYAGSMALTLAHEVGHLAGLGHVTDDPVDLMNVNEGAGLDYRDARFGTNTWAFLVERWGLTGDKPKKK
ncbi:MAG: hypothetical protein JNK78_16805 [Planctomycetes bacterium]|nr:hypothetical protein [Planctomycetota bacterium]